MATLRQRGNRWQAIVRKYGHRPVVESFGSKAAARVWATRTEAEVDAGHKVDAGRVARFADVLRSYRDLVTATRPMGRTKAQALDAIEDALGQRRVSELDVAALKHYADRRRCAGAGAATVGKDICYIGTALRHGAPLLGLDASRALESLRTARGLLAHAGLVMQPRERTRRPAEAELIRLREHWRAYPTREIPMWRLTLFAVATAMRLGEILQLEWAGLDRESRIILIRDRKHPTQKRGNDQRIPLLARHAVVAGELVDPLALIDQQQRGPALIFPFRPSSVSTAFTRAVQRCAIDGLCFHDLRHDGVSRLFEAGLPLEQVALISGHRDWNQLRRYTQIRAEHVR
jgi:Phage integrase family